MESKQSLDEEDRKMSINLGEVPTPPRMRLTHNETVDVADAPKMASVNKKKPSTAAGKRR